ncbi:hypothetical protein M569_00406, partial [Genlisea aurea]
VSSTYLNYRAKSAKCLRRENYFPIHLGKAHSGRPVYAVEDYERFWEDPDDGCEEDSDLEEDASEEEIGNVMEDDSDFRNVHQKLAMRQRDEDLLIREVEQMLEPEEREILNQNEAPNLEKLSTAKLKLLHSYALSGQIKFMDGLLEKGHDIDEVDKDGLTALHLAVIGKKEAVISHLLRKGANPEAKDLDGATPLHYAVQVGAMQTVKLLLIKYKVDVNVADNDGWTPLHVAVQTRNRYVVKILLLYGADRTRRNTEGHTALDLGLCYGRDFKSHDISMVLKLVP